MIQEVGLASDLREMERINSYTYQNKEFKITIQDVMPEEEEKEARAAAAKEEDSQSNDEEYSDSDEYSDEYSDEDVYSDEKDKGSTENQGQRLDLGDVAESPYQLPPRFNMTAENWSRHSLGDLH